MQSYYTLEGLSQSHRMAMNFKCGIKAYREAGTRGRLSQLSANLIFNFFFFLATDCEQEGSIAYALVLQLRPQIKPQREEIFCLNGNDSIMMNILFSIGKNNN